MDGESELQMVQRHVREGADMVLRQKAMVAELESAGYNSTDARALLASFEDIQQEHLAHLARITERESGKPKPHPW